MGGDVATRRMPYEQLRAEGCCLVIGLLTKHVALLWFARPVSVTSATSYNAVHSSIASFTKQSALPSRYIVSHRLKLSTVHTNSQGSYQ